MQNGSNRSRPLSLFFFIRDFFLLCSLSLVLFISLQELSLDEPLKGWTFRSDQDCHIILIVTSPFTLVHFDK